MIAAIPAKRAPYSLGVQRSFGYFGQVFQNVLNVRNPLDKPTLKVSTNKRGLNDDNVFFLLFDLHNVWASWVRVCVLTFFF